MLHLKLIRHSTVALVALVVSVVGAWGLMASPAYAAECGDAKTSIISCNAAKTGTDAAKDSANNPIISVLTFVMQILTGAVGIAAVGALIYAGILYSAAGGEASQVQKAKTLIKDTVIGIICYAGMILILNFVIPGGVFGQQSTVGGGTSGSTGGSSGSSGTHGGDLSVATYNIRTTNGNSWDSVRANSILDFMNGEDIVGIQEGKLSTTASKNSVGWLQSKLGSASYSNYAQEQGGEYRAIFWKNDKFTQLDKGNYNIDGNRNLVWVKLQYKSTGTAFYFMTTHLDYNRCKSQGHNTTEDCSIRTSQAKSIASYVTSHMTKGVPAIFVGDMNSQVGTGVYDAYLKAGFKNAYDIAKSKVNTDHGSTITNFSGGTSGNLSSGGKPIDHIYVMNDITVSRVEVTKHKGSDHVPVDADLSLPGTASSDKGGSTPSSSTAPKLSSNVANFRDAGTSGYIKTGILYRSANLNTATASDKLVLTGLLKGGKVIDLRLTADAGFSSAVDKSLTGVSYLHVGIKGEATAAGYKKTFINDSNMRGQFGKALDEIASSSGPALVHCKAGKDRTGWAVALAMMAVGVSKNNAMDEYDNSPDVQDSWFTAAYDEATNKAHTGGSGKIIDFITRDVSQGGLGVSQSTIDTLITKLRK